MALSTFDELKASIIQWSHRQDTSFTDLLDDFIALAEEEMFDNPDNILKVRDSEKTSTATVVGTSPVYRTPDALVIKSGVGTPRYFTITNEIEFDIVPDQDYTVTMKYFAEFTPLSTTNQTNEILANYSRIYLYGALKQAFVWSEDDVEAAKYDALFQDAIKGANKKADAGRYGPTPAMKVKGSTP
jgi:hypothetical protein